MDFIKIRFNDDRSQMENEMQSSLSGSLRFFEPSFTIYRRVWKPAVDICESSEGYTIIAELPGVRNEDLHLEIGGRMVRMYGTRVERRRDKQARYHLAEITYGYFERSLALPITVDADRVEAVFTEGLLEIRVPKTPPDRMVRKIHIGNRR